MKKRGKRGGSLFCSIIASLSSLHIPTNKSEQCSSSPSGHLKCHRSVECWQNSAHQNKTLEHLALNYYMFMRGKKASFSGARTLPLHILTCSSTMLKEVTFSFAGVPGIEISIFEFCLPWGGGTSLSWGPRATGVGA